MTAGLLTNADVLTAAVKGTREFTRSDPHHVMWIFLVNSLVPFSCSELIPLVTGRLPKVGQRSQVGEHEEHKHKLMDNATQVHLSDITSLVHVQNGLWDQGQLLSGQV